MDPQPEGGGRVVPSKSSPPPKPGHADTLKPSQERVNADVMNERDTSINGEVKTQSEMLNSSSTDTPGGITEKDGSSRSASNGQDSSHPSSKTIVEEGDEDYNIDFWEPKPPKVLMEDPDKVPLELRAQIQLYATTE